METNRDRIVKLLIGYLKNSLSQEEEAEFVTWLEQDDRNKALLKEFKATSAVEAKLKAMAALDEDAAWQSLRQQIESPVSTIVDAKRTRRNRLMTILSAASVVFLLTFLGLFFWKSPEKSRDVARSEERRVGKGGRSEWAR